MMLVPKGSVMGRWVFYSALLVGLAFWNVVDQAAAQDVAASPSTAAITPETGAGWGQMTAAQKEQAIAYSSTKNTLVFVGFVYGSLALLAILFTGLSARLLRWAERITKRRFLVLVFYLAVLLVVLQVLTLPLDYYSGFHVEHRYGLSNQTIGAWLGDVAKSLAVSLIFAVIIAAIGYALIRRRPRSWWAWMGVVSIPLLAFVMIIAPVVVTPLFNKTEPMEEGALRTQILDLAAKSGIPDSRVFVMDASKDTKKIGAYVAGLGQTQRIVLFDNTINAFAPAEVMFVVGHEMGHYLLHHVWIGLALAVALVFVCGYLAHVAMCWALVRYKDRFGFERLASFASAPLILLAFSVFSFLLAPVFNGVWRHFEHRADVFGLERTGDGAAAAMAFEKLAAVNLSNPNPSGFIKFWLYDHPTLSERVEFARAYESSQPVAASPLALPDERHLANVRQLTDGGENAEAYFDRTGRWLIFQSTRDGWPCDRIFTMRTDGTELRQVSTGRGATTCAFFAPDGQRIVYCSTHLTGDSCPPRASHGRGYVWTLHPGYDVFSARPDGSDLKRLTTAPGYDAEAVYSPDGSKILFTSVRDGDLELYVMNADGTDPVRLTHEVGYDGGAFFSPDGRKIVYRASHPTDSAAIAEYQSLLREAMIRPNKLEIFIMDADGSNKVQLTHNGAANFCPFFHPDGERIIFSSNMDDPKGRNFDLYMINLDGSGLERITSNDTFDGFPMFNADGSRLVFASNRNAAEPGETNIFIADWVE
ncbi:MAG: M48 family metalloprotease [Candidatus Zixiibacteriota bacterium]